MSMWSSGAYTLANASKTHTSKRAFCSTLYIEAPQHFYIGRSVVRVSNVLTNLIKRTVNSEYFCRVLCGVLTAPNLTYPQVNRNVRQ